VLDYLAECQGKWDGKKRIDTWVINYLGADDTPLNRAIGRLMLIASARRPRDPGCKFDQIFVLEGPQGGGKSTVILVLAGKEFFSDQSVLNVSDKEAQEQLEGIWLHESAELTGLKKADADKLKAFLSRQYDRARAAYGHFREDLPRRCTQWGTTNAGIDDAYLTDTSGNRRMWVLAVGRIDLEALRRDRNQLWGEAATLEAQGAPIVLDEALWPAAAEEQEKRRIPDDHKEMVASADVLVHVLEVPTGHQHPEHGRRLSRVMKRCGWQTSKSGRVFIAGRQVRGYWRG
jgi:predicted P-loop ATPase